MLFSFIIPVYNRPEEIEELLDSLVNMDYSKPFEVVIVEDGSNITCKEIVKKFQDSLSIVYFYKENSGPGDSRNFGMKNANGTYFIILDSDCIIPPFYLKNVERQLEKCFVDCFGGPDAALANFSDIQKAINFSMTSFLTTGGIRGGGEKVSKFQPRSFNMGISKKAFEASEGFGNIHPGEDPDLSIRLWKLGFSTQLFTDAFVYHKRRISWNKFFIQVNKFGKARPILNFWYPEYAKITFWFPTLFLFGFLFALFMGVFGYFEILFLFSFYFGIIFVSSLIQNKNLKIAILSVMAVGIQFYGYGLGFIKAYFNIHIRKLKPEVAHPELFFKV